MSSSQHLQAWHNYTNLQIRTPGLGELYWFAQETGMCKLSQESRLCAPQCTETCEKSQSENEDMQTRNVFEKLALVQGMS